MAIYRDGGQQHPSEPVSDEAAGRHTVTDASRIRLRRVLIRAQESDRFAVIRWGGTTRISTREAGIAAIRAMAGKLTIAQIKDKLAARYRKQTAAVDLSALVTALAAADLIQSIDGRAAPSRKPPSIRSLRKFLFHFYIKEPLLRFGARALPFQASLRLCFEVIRIDMGTSLDKKAGRALERLLELPGGRSDSTAQFRREHLRHLIWNMAEPEAIVRSSPAAIDRWMDRHVAIEGREHLDQGLARGRGVIFSPFHFGSTMLNAIALVREGYCSTLVAVPQGPLDADSRENRFGAYQNSRPGRGKCRLVKDFSLASYRAIVAALGQGEIVIWMADVFAERPELSGTPATAEDALQQARLDHLRIRAARSVLPQSRMTVAFRGGAVYMNEWIGAFAQATGAAVVPGAVIRDGANVRLVLRPAIVPDPAAGVNAADQVNEQLFRELDRMVLEYPAQWFGWHHLRMASAQDASGGERSRRVWRPAVGVQRLTHAE